MSGRMRRRPGPTTVGVDRFSSCAPLGGGDSYRVNGPAAVGVDR
jgi:hypothetical protein